MEEEIQQELGHAGGWFRGSTKDGEESRDSSSGPLPVFSLLSFISAITLGHQSLVVMNISTMAFVAPNLAWGKTRGGRIPAAGCNRRATKPQAQFGATRRAAVLLDAGVVVRSSPTAGGYARRSRLADAKNPWPQTPS
jgi:hypothetical protein